MVAIKIKSRDSPKPNIYNTLADWDIILDCVFSVNFSQES